MPPKSKAVAATKSAPAKKPAAAAHAAFPAWPKEASVTPYVPIAGGKASEAIAFYGKAFAAVVTRYASGSGRSSTHERRLLSPLYFLSIRRAFASVLLL